MGDSQIEAFESISGQPQYPNSQFSSNVEMASGGFHSRKKRGIYTSNHPMSLNRGANHLRKPWPVENSHIPRLDGGDNAMVHNFREQFLDREPTALSFQDESNMGGSYYSNSQIDPLLDESVNASEMIAEENRRSPIVEDVDNLIGSYQVNPMDGSLMKLLNMQPLDALSEDNMEPDIKMKREWRNDGDGVAEQRPQKRKYRKRKVREIYDQDGEYIASNPKPAAGIPKPTGDKAEEVLKAAKSLFSKRTRTLYHWLYPSTSKMELKSIVVSAWDTLQESEKHFYISQVLGRFGFPASNLMVNPQIGGLQGMPTDHLRTGALALASGCLTGATSSGMNDPTKRVVEQLLANENVSQWTGVAHKTSASPEPYEKRKRRKCRPKSPPDSEAELENESFQGTGDEGSNSGVFEAEDFQNDPELSKEMEAFRLNAGVPGKQENIEILNT